METKTIRSLEKNEKMKNVITFMLNRDVFENDKIILLYQITCAVLIGVCGTILVAMFLATFLSIFKVVNLIPWLIGFNTAMTGFSLIEKTRDRILHKHLWAVVAGLVNVVLTCGILTIASFHFLAENLLGFGVILFLLIIGAVCSELGARLAVKYLKLNKKAT
jgi:hypothetical protein